MWIRAASHRGHAPRTKSVRIALSWWFCPFYLTKPSRVHRRVVRRTCDALLAQNGGDRWANSIWGSAGGLTARFLLRGRRPAVTLCGKRDSLGSVSLLLILFFVCRALRRKHECLHVCLSDDPISGEAQLSLGVWCFFVGRALTG